MKDSILSTKVLTAAQVELVLNAGMSITHYDVLKTRPLAFDLSRDWDYVIISSKNAMPAVAQHRDRIKQVHCVGDVTAGLLTQLNINVATVAQNAAALAKKLASQFPNESFLYLCSKQRRDELPALFLEYKIPLKELFVYESVAVKKSFNRIFAAVIFYSPRGVLAFAKANPKQSPKTVICIGPTTSSTAIKYYDNVIIATKQTIENTLVTAIKVLRNDKK
jgi:uroporphyrinogen-III synthase